MSQLPPAPLVAAATKLAEEGLYGLVWLDENLMVTAKYGQLVSFIEIGDPITHQLPALFSYEADIHALGYERGNTFFVPAIALVTKDGHSPRVNLTVIRHKESPEYIILLGRALSGSTTDIELSQQMRKRLIAEEALALASKELEQANQDLEDYAAIISHDLGTPLRAIRYLTEDAEAANATGDKDRVAELLKNLKDHSRRMSGMMTALLEYASLTRKSDICEPVDTEKMINEIVQSLETKNGIRIEVKGDWPRFETLAAPLDLVIRNLIDNAIKHHDQPNGRVEVAANQTANWFEVTISDDGPGIDEKHHRSVLLPFRTLESGCQDGQLVAHEKKSDHKENPSKGYGIGLAIVKRTLDTLGGTLQLESNPALRRGTTFTIRWPKSIKSLP